MNVIRKIIASFLLPATTTVLLGTASVARAEEDFFFLAENEVADADLASMRGAAGTVFTGDTLGVAVLTGVAVNNVTNGGTTGSNSISGSAFDNSQGVSFVVQNSGNNAVINAAMVINLSVD